MDKDKELETVAPDNEEEDEIDLGPVLHYLSTEKGHEISTKILQIVDDVKKATLDKSSKHATLEIVVKIVIISLVVGAATLLTFFDKFNPVIGVLFGTLLGYFFAKK